MSRSFPDTGQVQGLNIMQCDDLGSPRTLNGTDENIFSPLHASAPSPYTQYSRTSVNSVLEDSPSLGASSCSRDHSHNAPRAFRKYNHPGGRSGGAYTDRQTSSSDDESSQHSPVGHRNSLQRSETVKLYHPTAEPIRPDLTPEEKQAKIVTAVIKMVRREVKKPERVADEFGPKPRSIRQYVLYFLKLRRIELSCMMLFFGEPELCEACLSLDLNKDSFLVQNRRNTKKKKGRSYFDPGTAVGRIYMGNMRFITYKSSICNLCRLIKNALAEQQRFKGWLERELVYSDILSEDQEGQLARLGCWVSWEIDGRFSQPPSNSHGIDEPISRSEIPPARTRRIRVDWEDRQEDLSSKAKPNDVVPAYLVLLARPAGLVGCSAAFLGQHVSAKAASVSLIMSWLKQCEKSHHMCNPTLNQSRSVDQVFGQPYFSLIDVRDKCLVTLPKGQRYAALSYTWGGFQFYNTIQRDVRASQRPGYFDTLETALPKTITDAMQLVSFLGIQYLWIDALCIIQDSKQSWDCNVQILDQVYGNAWFTICAADGTNPTVGLVGMDKALTVRQQFQNTERIKDGVHLMVTYPAESYIKRSLWNTRAWERLLSQRCIIFVEGRVFFQCRGGIQREDIFTEDIHGWSIEHQETPLKLLGVVLNRPLDAYMQCVKMYTERNLTKTDDMLNAFQGVGNFLSYILGKKGLLFGLPRSHFDWAMLWQLAPNKYVTYRGKQIRKPNLKQLREDFESILEILDQELVATNKDAISTVQAIMKQHFDTQKRKAQLSRKRATGKGDIRVFKEESEATYRAQKDSIEDMPTTFPTWSWCGWAGSNSEYYSHMLYGITSNVKHWLDNRTWITWYTRDREGRLKVVWEPDTSPESENSVPYIFKSVNVEQRWHGYSRDPNPSKEEQDDYGRSKANHWPNKCRSNFRKTLKEFPFRNTYCQVGEDANRRNDDLRFLQFFTWSARFRLQSFEVKEGSYERRYAILDYKDDICGVITPDRIGTWKYGPGINQNVSLEMGHESVFEFLAISEAKEFSQEECEGWREYRQQDADDWDLFYVLLVVEVDEVHYRFGLGKVTKEAFQNCCERPCEWKEIILG